MAQNELDQVFKKLKKQKKKALITYMAAGYPRFAEQKNLVKVLEEAGADILELGIPFSDPIADGPTIQLASQESLKHGTSLKSVLAWIKQLKKTTKLPIVIMSYMNPLLAFGLKNLARVAAQAGVSGIIIPDMIPEEAGEINKILKKHNIHLIFLVAPTTPPERQRFIAKATNGFLYAVSVMGVTGARRSFESDTTNWLNKLRRLSSRPVCVGFGISGPEQIKQLKRGVDGFIVGSALVDQIRKNNLKTRPAKIRKFIQSLAKECSHAA